MANIIRANSIVFPVYTKHPEYINSLFIGRYFEALRRLYPDDLNYTFIEMKNVKHYKIVENKTNSYIIKFPEYCILKSKLSKTNDAFTTLEDILQEKVLLYVHDENNNLIEYFLQDVSINRHHIR